MSDPALPDLVEALARRRYATMVARLVRALGPRQLELAEDVVQEAFVRALRRWPATGKPRDPEAWLFRVAKNLALDNLRRRSLGEDIEAELADWGEPVDSPTREPDGVTDDTLRMMFLCAHPSLSADARVPLVLKTVCGFGNAAIASALLSKEATMAQRLTRAKAALAAEDARFEMPSGDLLLARLDGVLASLYLLFNEGYRAHRGDELVRVDLVHEAIRLCTMLTEPQETRRPEVHALLALMLLLGARMPARIDEAGELLTLAQQDRARWDASWIAAGFHHLKLSIGGDRITAYHREARIASLHAVAADYESTDWPAILSDYDKLLALGEDPVVRLNRAVAVAKAQGPAAGLAALDELGDSGPLATYQLRLATRAQLHWELGQLDEARSALRSALDLPSTTPERRLLERRLKACEAGAPPEPW